MEGLQGGLGGTAVCWEALGEAGGSYGRLRGDPKGTREAKGGLKKQGGTRGCCQHHCWGIPPPRCHPLVSHTHAHTLPPYPVS